MPFCPKCGVDIEIGKTFCTDHTQINLDVKPFSIRLCECGRFFSHNHWFKPNNWEESVLKVAREHIKQKPKLKLIEFTEPLKRGKKTKGQLVASYQGDDFPVEFPILKQQCDKCAKLGTHYFTAILQLRNPPKDVLTYIKEFMAPLEKKGVSINKVMDTPRGPDLYLTHKATARQLGEKLVRKFGGSMKQSEQLFSRNRQSSKNLYRLNVVVEFATFKIGDAVLLDNNVCLITGLGKTCTARDLKKNKKVVFTSGDEESILQKSESRIVRVKPTIQVLHPESYQPVEVANHIDLIGTYELDEKVTVVGTSEIFIA